MEIKTTKSFGSVVKKLHKNQKSDLDQAVHDILSDPLTGELKKADLMGVRVHKFKMVNQLTLLAYAYEPQPPRIILLALGSHENFYRDLKKTV